MSIESINRRLVTHGAVYTCSGDDGRLEIYDYADADLRALLKVAEAAKEYRSSQQVQMLNAIEYDAPKVERQRIAKKALDAALDELEAQE